MTQLEIIELLEGVTIPIIRIETDLGIPIGVLNKAKKGDRNLPKKYDEPLKEYLANCNIQIPLPSSKLKEVPIIPNQVGFDNINPIDIAFLVNFCTDNNCTPLDLIEAYKQNNKDTFQEYINELDMCEDLASLNKVFDKCKLDNKTITYTQFAELKNYYIKLKEKFPTLLTFSQIQNKIVKFKEDYPTEEEWAKFALEIDSYTHISEKQKALLITYLKN